jgi:hypothetical protein
MVRPPWRHHNLRGRQEPRLVPLVGDGSAAFSRSISTTGNRHTRADSDRFAGLTLEPVGPEGLSVPTSREAARLAWPAGPFVLVPLPLMRFASRVADLLAADRWAAHH